MVWKRLAGVVALALFLGWPLLALAQSDEPATPTPVATTAPTTDPTPAVTPTLTATVVPSPTRPPTHTIVAGETLVTIAEQYSVTIEALQLINNISDPELIFAGQELVIPGELGDEVPAVYIVQPGDTLGSIALRFNTAPAAIAAANRLVSEDFLYSGLRLSLISRTGTLDPLPLNGRPYVTAPGETVSEIALKHGLAVAAVREANGLAADDVIFPGQRLRLPTTGEEPFEPGLPGEWERVTLSPAAPNQGDTAVLTVQHATPGQPLGQLIAPDGQTIPLRFFAGAVENVFHALVGFDAFAVPGRYRLQLEGSGPARPWFALERAVAVSAIDYGLQQILLGDEFAALLDATVRETEDAYLNDIFVASAAKPLWTGVFQQPVTNSVTTAIYGSDRTYNGGPVIAFHTGIDFGGSVGTPIVAPAAGRVVLIEPLELRGTSLVLDHGGGVMTAYYHLSETFVEMGTEVTTGQTIAAGGNSGLSTGPHLHWDVRVWGAAVDPQPWLTQTFP